MASAIETLRSMIDEPDPFAHDRADLLPLWIEGLNERIERGIELIPVLRQLVEKTGVRKVTELGDVVPLLFAHTNYKSYPQSFIAKGRWAGMNTWLDTVSAQRVDNVDIAGVADQDDWLARLHAAGHMVLATSGTSGRNSFLPNTREDQAFSMRGMVPTLTWSFGIEPRADRPVFFLSPKYGPTRVSIFYRTLAEAYGRPDATYFLTEEPLLLTEMSRLATLRKAIVDGTARPSEIAEHEATVAARAAEMNEKVVALVDAVLAHRHEPMIISGFWSQFWMIVETARARGVTEAHLHPDTVLMGGGGTKGAVLPPDYQQQILSFFGVGNDRFLGGYGMSEQAIAMPRVGDRYRIAPWVVPLVLDKTGEHALGHDGLVEGRYGFVDLSLEGRWGGLITGDRVTADFTQPQSTIVDGSVARYSDLEGGDDKLTCAGTIDAFVRGMV